MSEWKDRLLFCALLLLAAALILFGYAIVSQIGQHRLLKKNPHPRQKHQLRRELSRKKAARRAAWITAAAFLAGSVLCALPGLWTLYVQKTAEELTPFNQSLAYACKTKNTEMVGELLLSGADVNEVRGGWTPLMFACQFDEAYDNAQALNIAEILLQRGAQINATDESGHTALMFAAQSDAMLSVTAYLLDHGAQINAIAVDTTALSSACSYGAAQTVSLLLEKGARTDGQYNPLREAVYPSCGYARYDVLKRLLDHGVDTDIMISMTDEDTGKTGKYTPAQCITMDYEDYLAAGCPAYDFGTDGTDWEANYRNIRSLPGFS